MSFIRKFAYSASGLLLALMLLGLLLPSTAHVERQIQIDAPPASVFGLINDFNQISQWSPWVATDSSNQRTQSKYDRPNRCSE